MLFRDRRQARRQRALALHEVGERGGDFTEIRVVLLLVGGDDAFECREILCFDGCGNEILEFTGTTVRDVRLARQRHRFDRLARGLLDRAQHAGLTRGDEDNRLPAAPGTRGAADAMDIRFRIVGNIVIEHVANAADIESACRDVGRDDNVDETALEPIDRPFAQGLVHVPVQRATRKPARLELFREFHGRGFRAHENHHAIEILDFEDPGQRVEFVPGRNLAKPLTHRRHGGGF